MTVEGNGQPLFRLAISSVIREAVVRILDDAAQRQIAPQVRHALKTIFRRLRHDPLNFGEVYRTYKNPDFLMHMGMIAPIVVHFGIQQQMRFVFIQSILLV
jgi:hypothetical protein